MSMPIQFSSLISGSFSPNHRLYYGKKPVSSFRCMASLSSDPEFNSKEFRKNLTRREDYNRQGFGRKKETLELISREYYSDVIKTLNENGNEYTWGSVTVKLAESYGLISGHVLPNKKFTKTPISSFRCMASLSMDPEFDTKKFRKDLTRRPNYNRQGFGHKQETLELISREYYSDVIKTLKANGNEYTWGDVTVKLAKSYGFCWGTERAIQLVYEAKDQFPDQKIWITNEIIHNPTFSKKVESLDIKYLPKNEESKKQYDVIEKGDVVMFPAHGVAVEEMMILSEKNVQIVDTTCPWVSKVWTTVEKHKSGQYTSIIHGNYEHQETIGTKSFAENYVVVRNMEDAMYVCDYILGRQLNESSSTKEAFLEKFKDKVSEGFDPDKYLVKVGIANQTTVLKGETEEIGKLVERTMMQKHGVENINNHFMSFNTICDATQERQDALEILLEDKLDVMLVVGGWNSDNTGRLQMISESKAPAYWVDSEERIGPGNRITYKLSHDELVEKESWLAEGPITIGVTAGASTPDKVIEDVLLKVFAIKNGKKLQHA
ncbi:Hydroxyl-2-methyl-2-(E)-butenyl 4-diphosphate reductase [Heracleum sosnowskyi]|uniref:4-hydroxy-3-methylbut-2-enyl diphosphate reductase n=1 Tax=Heracleum sosnowskyi TaxID=360622 RepID=A0AAD8N5R1_9APIA|nr:Hydroxyl-2-methyl-2-(E)-butenyl 4-diphosphate reductase [Heracleum sosnowskyi]